MAEEKTTFDLEPLPEPEKRPDPPKPPAPKPEVKADVKPDPVEPAHPGLIGKLGGMLDGFDDDADFESDPEVDRALGKGEVKPAGAPVPEAPERPPLVKPGIGPAGVWVGAGSVMVLGAVIGAAVTETNHPVVASLLAIYNAGLHTCTGVAALALSALLMRRPLGSIEIASSRMFAAVAAFLLIANLRIDLVGHTPIEELALGTIVYVGVVAGAFRIWRRPMMYVVCAHFILWMAVQVGMELTAWVQQVPTKP